jgi:dephospho-CoA kinase
LPLIDADVLAREVVEPKTAGFKSIVRHFGPDRVRCRQSDRRLSVSRSIYMALERTQHDLVRCVVLAREVVEPKTAGFKSIVRHFGPDRVLKEDGTLDRAALGEIVFNDPEERKPISTAPPRSTAAHRQPHTTPLGANTRSVDSPSPSSRQDESLHSAISAPPDH